MKYSMHRVVSHIWIEARMLFSDKMYGVWIVLIFYVLSVIARPEDLCGKFNEKIAAELDKCNQLAPDYVQKIISDCQLRVLPNEEVKEFTFLTAGCKDKSIFSQFFSGSSAICCYAGCTFVIDSIISLESA
ncbi:uncharacterized protein [Parasteatoda tepidariorum]|uniref:uncharacterized protein isoform X2 n=1 Tax=Parasteatoda tepidariorum TaxID=114398 RepID=UPI0039BD8890